MILNEHFSAISSEFEKLQSRLTQEQMGNEARIRNDYLVRQTLENALKPNQDLNKAVLAVIELLKPFTCQGPNNTP
jgi:hypothetical protein